MGMCNLRRIIGVAAALGIAGFLILGIVPAASATGVAVSVNGMWFGADDSDVAAGASVEGFSGPAVSTLVIPDTVTINGTSYVVTSIEASAFSNQPTLTSVTLPNGLLEIGQRAFRDSALTSVVIPDSVTTMGLWAFESNALTSVVIGNGLAVIPAGGFQNNQISSLTIGTGVTTILAQAFFENQLTTVAIGGSVTDIGTYAFASNVLTSVTLSAPLTTIEQSAFQSNNLTSVTLPATVTTIEGVAFWDNNNLTSVTFLGPAPTTFSDANNGQSLGSVPGLVVHYLGSNGGFTYPSWMGYNTAFVATATFDLNGHGAAIAAQTVQSGDLPIKPSDPDSAPWVFKGWYTDAALTDPADFSAPLSSNQTFFARWDPALALTGDTINYPALWAAILSALIGTALVLWSRRRPEIR
jgi:uncharacterized repeat protein (TIGR02543 family)